MAFEKDYTHRSFVAVALLIALLVGVSFIPPQTVAGFALRRANILSELFTFDDAVATKEETTVESDFQVDLQQVAERIADTIPQQTPTRYEWLLEESPAVRTNPLSESERLQGTLIPIEDFDTTGDGRLRAFYDKLKSGRETVRIAVLGDSFVEGDILSADLREKLQLRFGGSGAGFAPMASPLTGFRRTIKTQSRGWNSYNLMQRRTTPADISDSYYISGWLCRPADGASVRWEGTSERERLDSCRVARIFFTSRRDSRVEVTVNDTQSRTFEIEGATSVREIVVHAPIRSLTFKVHSGAAGFIGYGALFESGTGVVVDNYSVRSNNGQALFWTSPSVNAQIDAMLAYDLVILQYGLNIMQPGVRSYTKYGEQIEQMIAYARQCFPSAAILVMSVSDRSVRSEQGYTAMDSAPYLVQAQRRAAANAGAAFWNTYEAMRSLGGMTRFVANGWAGKDYTHINFAGGRRVAWALYDAINEGVRTYVPTWEKHESILSAEQVEEFGQGLLAPNTPDPVKL